MLSICCADGKGITSYAYKPQKKGDYMKQLIIGSEGAINVPGIGWCWYYENKNYDDTSFDYCLKKCNERESIMLEEIYKRREQLL